MMKTTPATVIVANTFVGNGSTPEILIVQPTFEKQIVRHGYTDEYDQEAGEVFMWLQGAFCNKTLAELASRLSCYKKDQE